MQLGKRWPIGTSLPAGLPDVVVDAVRGVEDELRAVDTPTDGWSWTLTWLEGRPIVELDDGTLVTFNPESGTATVRQTDETEEDDDY